MLTGIGWSFEVVVTEKNSCGPFPPEKTLYFESYYRLEIAYIYCFRLAVSFLTSKPVVI